MGAGSIDSWGPALWRFLHASSFSYPETPDPKRQRQMFEFLKIVGTVLPCATCREHYEKYVATHLDERATQSKSSLVQWITNLHNSVNRRTGKREWSLREVQRVYEAESSAENNCIRDVVWILMVALVISVAVVLWLKSGVKT